jgi:predicted RNase H-like HicB family nuclease
LTICALDSNVSRDYSEDAMAKRKIAYDGLKTYTFRVVLEEDPFPDGRQAYLAYCPALKGATTWGYTPHEALRNLQEVITLILEDMQAHGEPLPTGRGVTVSTEPKITVTL